MSNQIDHITATALEDVCAALRKSSSADDGDFDHAELGGLVARARRIIYGVALALASTELKDRLCKAIACPPHELPVSAALAHDRHVLCCLSAHSTWLDEVDDASGDATRALVHVAKMPVVWWPTVPRAVVWTAGGAA